ELLDGRSIRPEYSEDELDVDREVYEPVLGEVRQIVEVPNVIRLVLGLRPGFTEQLRQPVEVGKRVAKNVLPRGLEVVDLPSRHLGPVRDLEDAEVEAPRVERRELGPQLGDDARTLVDRHSHTAAGRRLDDRVAPLADPCDDLAKQSEIGRRL